MQSPTAKLPCYMLLLYSTLIVHCLSLGKMSQARELQPLPPLASRSDEGAHHQGSDTFETNCVTMNASGEAERELGKC